MMQVQTEKIPKALRQFDNWVLWKKEYRDEKETKVPYQITGRHAKPNDSSTWTSFSVCVATLDNGGSYNGLGFCLTEGTPVGIDLDHCRCPAFTNFGIEIIAPWAKDIINDIGSYAEESPSGQGVHIFAYSGKLPEHGRNKKLPQYGGDNCRKDAVPAFEIYELGRYLTITGNRIAGTPTDIMNRPEEINAFHKHYFGSKEELPQETERQPFIIELNKNHAIINFSGRFFILEETIDPTFGHHKIQFSSAADFKNLYANRFIMRPHPTIQNRTIKIYIADEWIHSPHRREYKGIVFEPMEDIPGYYNLWQGFAIEPKEGDWSLMKEHIRDIICQRNEDIARWVFAWMAKIVQKPGKDLQGTCIVLMGEQGAGKGIFAREFGSIFGGHYLHLNNINQITGRFNAHLANKLFVFCDEALWDGSDKAAGVIKGLITEPTFPVEYKGKDIFDVKNHANFIIASNSSRVVPAGEKERRFCVLDVSSEKAGDIQYFKAIMDQMNNGGREAMLYELLHSDISGIDLRIIPKTTALTEQAIHNLESVPKFWLHYLTNQDCLQIFKVDGKRCLTKSYLYKSYRDFCKNNNEKNILSNNSFGKAIRRYCPGIQDGRSSPDEGGNRPNLYILPPLNECRRQFEKKIGMQGVFEP